MPLPIHPWPISLRHEIPMTNKRITSGELSLSTANPLTRFAGVLLVALSLHACDTAPPKPLTTQPEASLQDTSANPASPPAPLIPSFSEEQAISAISDENNVFFASSSTVVDERGKQKLHAQAELLKIDPKKKVTLIGYSDDLGSKNYNLALTEERLIAVQKTLRSYGVSPSQIHRNRAGSSKMQRGCVTPDCRQQMRRVELILSP